MLNHRCYCLSNLRFVLFCLFLFFIRFSSEDDYLSSPNRTSSPYSAGTPGSPSDTSLIHSPSSRDDLLSSDNSINNNNNNNSNQQLFPLQKIQQQQQPQVRHQPKQQPQSSPPQQQFRNNTIAISPITITQQPISNVHHQQQSISNSAAPFQLHSSDQGQPIQTHNLTLVQSNATPSEYKPSFDANRYVYQTVIGTIIIVINIYVLYPSICWAYLKYPFL